METVKKGITQESKLSENDTSKPYVPKHKRVRMKRQPIKVEIKKELFMKKPASIPMKAINSHRNLLGSAECLTISIRSGGTNVRGLKRTNIKSFRILEVLPQDFIATIKKIVSQQN